MPYRYHTHMTDSCRLSDQGQTLARSKGCFSSTLSYSWTSLEGVSYQHHRITTYMWIGSGWLPNFGPLERPPLSLIPQEKCKSYRSYL